MSENYKRIRSTILANLGLDYTVTDNLLKLYFAEDIWPDKLTNLFSKYDIEVLDFQTVWLLSKLASRLQYNGVPKEQIPRIKGVVRRFTVENGRSFCTLPGILDALNKADVAVMLLNGTAMKAFYEPEETRYSSSIDILVHAGDIKRISLVLEEQGFILKDACWEQRVFQKSDVRIGVHSTYLRANLLTGELVDVWQYSLEIDWQGKRIRVPSPEMMLLITLTQGLEAFCSRINNSFDSQFVLVFLDIKFFLGQTTLNWIKFIEIVKKSKLSLQVHLMLGIINHLFPESVSEEILDALIFTDKDVVNIQNLISHNIAKKQMNDARNRMDYYRSGFIALWYLNCYYGNRDSCVSDIIAFPFFINAWNNRGIKGLLSKLGGYR